jgi:hypothetical protein
MGATGSVRGANVDGIPYNVTADTNIALNDRIEKESIPHSGGNIQKRTLMSASAEAVKLTLSASEYVILQSQASELGDIPLSYTMADGSVARTSGEITLGPFQSEDNSCEVTFLTSTGVWEIFAA